MNESIHKPFCSIIIRAYNEERHISRLLTGIQQQTVKDVEIILVDSGSTDHTQDLAQDAGARIVKIAPQDFSFGRALNLGIFHATADLLVIASAHVYPVYPDWLEQLLKPFESSQVALSYGKQRGPQSAHFSEHQIFARWYPDAPQPRQPHPFCNNANAAVRRAVWEHHPYDEMLSGLEDLAWANWAMGQGHAISYVPEAEIIHCHNETPHLVYRRYQREAIAFKRIFPQEKFHFWDFVRLFLANVAADMWQAVHQRLLLRHLYSILWFRWNQFWGTYQGFRRSGPLTWQLRQTFYYPQSLDTNDKPFNRTVEPIEYSKQGEINAKR